jgi:hypothetical protein
VNRTLQSAVLMTVAVLLLAILAVLVFIAVNGIRIEHTGVVSLTGLTDRMQLVLAEPVQLEISQPALLTVVGPTGSAVPLQLGLTTCPAGGEPLLPTRWNLWSGEIEWARPASDSK